MSSAVPANCPDLDALHTAQVQCRLCPRLVAWREEVAAIKRRAYRDQVYWGKPVPGFGDSQARLLVLGLAPGAHGSNRTGRMFTGDGSGNFLFPALYAAGFASQPDASHQGDGLMLKDMYITAIVRCVPPANKPLREEVAACLPWLQAELRLLKQIQGVVLLGKMAFDALRSLPEFAAYDWRQTKFGHGLFYPAPDEDTPWLLCSYHPSMQNTQTGKLTQEMFAQIWQKAKDELR